MSQEKADWIPAHIEQNGPAKVDLYFDSRVSKTAAGDYIGFFRGHELSGSDLKLPEGYSANLVVIQDNEIKKVESLNPVRVWDLDRPSLDSFQSFTDTIKIGQIIAEDQ